MIGKRGAFGFLFFCYRTFLRKGKNDFLNFLIDCLSVSYGTLENELADEARRTFVLRKTISSFQ